MKELYASSPIAIRDDLAAAHARAWERIGRPGTWWDGAARVAIAAETRHASSCKLCRRRKEALSPAAIEGTHDSLGELSEVVVEVVHQVRNDPGRLSERWYRGVPRLNVAQGGQGLLFRPAQDHKVVGPRVRPLAGPRTGSPHHPATALLHQEVERMQVDIGQERRDDRPLGRPRRRPPARHVLHDILLEEALDQRQDLPVAERMRHQGHQSVVRDGVEIALQVSVHHEGEPFLQQVPGQPPARAGVPGIDFPQRIPRFREGQACMGLFVSSGFFLLGQSRP